jgi:hypothetical protein
LGRILRRWRGCHSKHMQELTILKLELRKLDALDIVSIVSFSITILLTIIFPEARPHFICGWVCTFVSYYLICTTSFGLRFRNVYFSIIWLILSLVFLNVMLYSIGWFPLAIFIFYHLIRVLFWRIHNREFIPQPVGRGGVIFRRKSKREGRAGIKADKIYMKVLLWGGLL